MDYRARTGAGSQIVPLTVDAPYFNSYWLYQITVWTIYRVWGTAGLVASHYLAAIVAYALVASQAVKRAGGISPWLAPLLLIGLFGNYWEVRPHVVSWLFLALLLGLLDRRDTRWIWISPVLMLVWANAHSLFILGWVAIAAHAVEVFRLGKAGAHRRFWFAAALSLAAPLANPYGWQGICVPFQQWQNLQTGSAFKSAEFGIHEHLSPFSLFRYFAATGEFRLVQPVLAMHLFTALAALTLLISIRRVCLREWLLVGLFGYVYSLAEKNFGYFLIAAFPIVAGHLDGLASRQTAGRSAQLIRALPAATAALAAAGTWWVLSGSYFEYLKSPMRTGHRFNPDFLPVGAAAFINAAGLPSGARILNNLDAGGYLAFATRRDVFIDGSLESIPGMFYREYARSKDLRELPSFLARWRPDAVVIPYSDIPQWLAYFDRDPKWRLAYFDARDAVYLRMGFADHVPALEAFQPGKDHPDWSDSEAGQIIVAHGTSRGPILHRLFERRVYPIRNIRLSAFCLATRRYSAAAGFALEGLRLASSPNPDLLLNAGHAFYALKKWELARLCYSRLEELGVLRRHPRDPAFQLARERLRRLEALSP